MFSSETYDQVRQAIEKSHSSSGVGNFYPVPSVPQIRAIIDSAFRASLLLDEGRPIRFSLLFEDRSRLEEWHGHLQHGKRLNLVIQKFAASVPLESKEIAKLASAFDRRSSSLVVTPDHEGSGSLVIWGAIHENPDWLDPFGFQAIGFDAEDYVGELELGPARSLKFAVESAGRIAIGREAFRIGHFDLGQFHPLPQDVFHSEILGEILASFASEAFGVGVDRSRGQGVYVLAIIQLLLEAGRRSHGATIVIVPSPALGASEQSWWSKHHFSANFLIREGLLAFVNPDAGRVSPSSRDVPLSLKVEKLRLILKRRLGQVAQLASVDGALLLSPGLDPVAFGAKLMPKDPPVQVVTGTTPDGPGGEPFDIHKLGTRHNSAASFVAAVPGSVAFVISTDGPVRAFTRQDETAVLVWPDCRQGSLRYAANS